MRVIGKEWGLMNDLRRIQGTEPKEARESTALGTTVNLCQGDAGRLLVI